jgi:C-terminal processing protease CtpA/Prc
MRKLIFIFFLMLFVVDSQAQMLNQPYNLGFEIGVPGNFPFAWKMTKYAKNKGYLARVSAEKPIEGKYCLEFSNANKEDGLKGDVFQGVDAAAFRGKNVRIRAAIRGNFNGTSWANIWLRTKLQQERIITKETTDASLNITNDWQYAVIEGRVDEQVVAVDFGVELEGSGTVWIDDFDIEIIYDESKFEPASNLSETELKNLAVFAKSYSLLRYFYAGSEIGLVNWEDFTYKMVKECKDLETLGELQTVLQTKLEEIAPLFSIYKKGEKDPSESKDRLNFPEAMDSINLSMRYDGPFTGIAEDFSERKLVNLYRSQRDLDGILIQQFNSEELRGMKVKYSAYVKADVLPPSGRAHIYLTSKTKYNDPNPIISINPEPITDNKWVKYSIETTIPTNSDLLVVGVILMGDGEVWIDHAELEIVESQAIVELPNAMFENKNAEGELSSWYIPEKSLKAGYSIAVSDKKPEQGSSCGYMYSNLNTRISVPDAGDISKLDLGNGLMASMPLSLTVDDIRTLPYSKSDYFNQYKFQKLDFAMNGADRNSRLAISIMIWSLFENFSMYENNESSEQLRELLKNASEDTSSDEFIKTINDYLLSTGDPLTLAWQANSGEIFGLPFSLMESEGKYYIKNTVGSNLPISKGDEILSIDGVEISKLVDQKKSLYNDPNPKVSLMKAMASVKVGKEGTKTEVEFKHNGEESDAEFEFNTSLRKFEEYRPPKMFELDSGIFYVDLSRISYDDIKDLGRVLEKGYRGVIFDVRGKVQINDYLLGLMVKQEQPSFSISIPVYTKPFKEMVSQKLLTSKLQPKKPYLGDNIYFLTDYRSAGLSEALLNKIKQKKLGTLIGSRTAGLFRDSFTIIFPGEISMTMSGMKFLTSDNKDLFGKPIESDIKIEYSIEDRIQEKDRELEEAVRLIMKK